MHASASSREEYNTKHPPRCAPVRRSRITAISITWHKNGNQEHKYFNSTPVQTVRRVGEGRPRPYASGLAKMGKKWRKYECGLLSQQTLPNKQLHTRHWAIRWRRHEKHTRCGTSPGRTNMQGLKIRRGFGASSKFHNYEFEQNTTTQTHFLVM